MEEILNLLDKVRKTSDGYKSLCPVHMGSGTTLGIAERDGKIIANCFSCGANGLDLVKALGLPVSVLFDGPGDFVPDKEHMLKKTQMHDDTIILIAMAAEERGEKIKYSDYQGLKISLARRDQRKLKRIDQLEQCSTWNPADE